MGSVLIWVAANWVATEPEGLPGADVEVVALGRDMGRAGDVGHITIPDSVAGVELYVPSCRHSPAFS